MKTYNTLLKFFWLISTMLNIPFCGVETISYQEGVNGYSGCLDSHLYNKSPFADNSNKQVLEIIDCPN